MRIGAFIITYNRPHILKTTIEAILQQTFVPECILIIDNGDAEVTAALLSTFNRSELIHHPLGDNLGPAAAEAIGLQLLCQRGYDWLYWIDDDNPPEFENTVERLLAIVQNRKNIDDVAGVAAVGQSFDWKEGRVKRLPNEALHGTIDVDIVGGNGQFILRSKAVQSVGWPDEQLFIDFEDSEYCLRLRRAGYRLLVDGDFMRLHRERFGRLQFHEKQTVLSSVKRQAIWRQYYSTRNFIFVMRNTFGRPDLSRREALRAVGRTLLAWRQGIQYGVAFSHLQLLGLIDGYRGRMGRTVLPKPKYGS